MQLLPRDQWSIVPILPPDGGPVLHWQIGAWVHEDARVWALASPGIPHPVAERAPAAAKPWPRGLPEGFEGMDVLDLDSGEPVRGVIRYGPSFVVRLKTDADGDFMVDAHGRAVEEKLSGRFHMDTRAG